MPDSLLGPVGQAVRVIRQGDENPDDTGGQQHRLGLAQVNPLFQDNHYIGGSEDDNRDVTHPVRREIQGCAGALRGRGPRGNQQTDKKNEDLGHENLSACDWAVFRDAAIVPLIGLFFLC